MTTLEQRLEGVEGYLHPDEPAFLASLAEQVQPGMCIVEIGAFRGRSTIALAHGAPGGVTVYSIDPHEEHEVQGLPFGMADNADFIANVNAARLGHKVRAVNLPALAAFQAWTFYRWRKPIGLVFIDGAHEHPAVQEDVEAWGSWLEDGGLLALHDANTWDGPTRVADELATNPQWSEIEGCAYTRVFRKGAANATE